MENKETENNKEQRVADVSFSIQYDLTTKVNIPYYLDNLSEGDVRVFVKDQMENKNPYEFLQISDWKHCELYQIDDIEIEASTTDD